MKRISTLFQVAVLGLVGCTSQSTPVASSPSEAQPAAVADAKSAAASEATAAPDGTAIATLVSLKVPNMH